MSVWFAALAALAVGAALAAAWLRAGGARTVAIAVVLLVPALATGLYTVLGTDEVESAPPSLATLVAELDARLVATPDDLHGWMLLGRSRVVLGDYAAAIVAWRHALRLAPADPTVLANLAEALVLDDASLLPGEAAWMIEAVLATDPANAKALWYGGLLAEVRGDPALATARWQALLAQGAPAALQAVIEQRIAGLFALTIGIESAPTSTTEAPVVLFVTAHDPAATGAPPLAAVRVEAPVFPMTITMTGAAVMTAGTRLGEYDALRLVARVSASGEATRRSGDRIGVMDWRRGDASPIIVIDTVLE